MTLERGYIPVVSGIAQGVDGEEVYNINADTAAVAAVALGAIKLILLTDVRGVMAVRGRRYLVSVMNLQCGRAQEVGRDLRGMIPKIDCCVAAPGAALRGHIIDEGSSIPY